MLDEYDSDSSNGDLSSRIDKQGLLDTLFKRTDKDITNYIIKNIYDPHTLNNTTKDPKTKKN